nr:MAG TPA: hypothetical protein [Caudoviricetes sp.]
MKPNRPGLTIGAFSIIKHKQSWPILKMLQTPHIRSSAVKINNSQRIVHE